MTFTLTVNCNGPAFKDDEHRQVAAILRLAARDLTAGSDDGNLHDVNGNKVGRFQFERTPK